MAVGIGHIGLDVVDGGTIHEIGSQHMDDGTPMIVPVDMGDAHRRQSQRIRTERRTGSKYAHLLVAAQQRRPHHQTVGGMPVGRKSPNQPEIIEPIHAPKRVCIAIGRLKHDFSLQFFHQSTLFGDAKLGCKRRSEDRNWFYFHHYITFISFTTTYFDHGDTSQICSNRWLSAAIPILSQT